MNYETQAFDWKVSGLGKLSGAAGLAAGVWLFGFGSNSAQCRAILAFSGMGGGLGLELKLNAAAKGLGAPLFADGEGNFINCDRAFSASELNGKFGLISSVGASAGAGYGVAAISAFSIRKNYFKLQPVHGWNAGVGVSAIHAFGTWWHISNPGKLGIVVS